MIMIQFVLVSFAGNCFPILEIVKADRRPLSFFDDRVYYWYAFDCLAYVHLALYHPHRSREHRAIGDTVGDCFEFSFDTIPINRPTKHAWACCSDGAKKIWRRQNSMLDGIVAKSGVIACHSCTCNETLHSIFKFAIPVVQSRHYLESRSS
jgi:hypothetical protein